MFAYYLKSLMSTAAALLAGALGYLALRQARRSRLPYPPGPRTRLVIGNMFDVPRVKPWKTYMEWALVFGDIIHFSIFGQHFIIINSEEIAHELLEKRSKLYSTRHMTPMLELMGWNWNLGFMPYGDSWRLHRKVFHDAFQPSSAALYQHVQLSQVHRMLRKFLATPHDFESHIRYLAGGIIMKTLYGYDIAEGDDHFVDIAEKALKMVSDTSQPGSMSVNMFPVLRYLPTWFPGANFHRYALASAKLVYEMRDAPWDFVREKLAEGTASPSIAADFQEKLASVDGYLADEDTCRNVAGVAYGAGVDTIVASFSTAVLAMVKNPDAVRRAQAEIDSVIGTERLPTWEDRDSLPYVEAFYREVMRWHPALPLGVPHATSEDDVYQGYFIPKGTTVLTNIYAMTHNVNKYADLDSFTPERYITPDGKLNDDNTDLVFGHGRRICPGRYFADATMWAAIASVLAAFDIVPATSEDGKAVEIALNYTDGLVSHPLPFACNITPRSAAAERLVLQTMTSQ